MASNAPAKTAKQIQSEIDASRTRLANTIDELVFRTQPKELARRQAESLRLVVDDATRTADGDLRHDRLAMGLGAVGGVLLLLGVIKRARS